MRSEGIFPPVKCATGLRYIPSCSRSPVSLDFRLFQRKSKIAPAERKENKSYGDASVGTASPTKSTRGVLAMFTGRLADILDLALPIVAGLAVGLSSILTLYV